LPSSAARYHGRDLDKWQRHPDSLTCGVDQHFVDLFRVRTLPMGGLFDALIVLYALSNAALYFIRRRCLSWSRIQAR
jgi:hypothetical protein